MSYYKWNVLKEKPYFKILYRNWNNMLMRCSEEYGGFYSSYRSKNIKVCDEWLPQNNGFINFYNWAVANGFKYEKVGKRNKWSIDRIDNNKGYSPDNCRWTTWDIQMANKTYNNKEKRK